MSVRGRGRRPSGEQYDERLLAEGDRRNVVDRYRYWTLEAIVADLDARRHDFHVAIENWQHDFNIGTIVRSANAFLAGEVHIVGNRRWNRRGAMVTDRYQHVVHHEDVASLAAYLRERDRPGGAVGHRQPARLAAPRDHRGAAPVCFLFGQEGPGLSEGAREACDATFSIAQFGSTRSINASRRRCRGSARPCTRRAGAGLTSSDLGSDRPGARAEAKRAPLEGSRPWTDRLMRHPRAEYAEMLGSRAQTGRTIAYPAINVSSSQTLNAALQGFAEAGSTGSIQVSTGGAEYLSGPTVKNMVTGSVAFAAYAREVAASYPVNIALHTDHCPKDKLDGFVRPLLDLSVERVARGEEPLFQSHMWDGSAVPLDENLQIAEELLASCAKANVVLEIEVGVVGGEEDGVDGAIDEKLYSTPEDALATVAALGTRRERPLPDRADLRQRARRLQAGQRQAASGDPARRPRPR